MCSTGVWAQTHDYMAEESDSPSVADAIFRQVCRAYGHLLRMKPHIVTDLDHPTQHPVQAHTRWLMCFETIDIYLISMGSSSDSSNAFLSLLLHTAVFEDNR